VDRCKALYRNRCFITCALFLLRRFSVPIGALCQQAFCAKNVVLSTYPVALPTLSHPPQSAKKSMAIIPLNLYLLRDVAVAEKQ
jgi:hypothetical protein